MSEREGPAQASPPDSVVRVTALGHASVLVEGPGIRLVCDPVLGDGLGPGFGRFRLWPGRIAPPVLRAHELGPLDAVLLTHAHWDHTCPATLRAIARHSPHALAVVQRGNLDLARRFRRRVALRWGERAEVRTEAGGWLRILAVPARHWGARLVYDRWRGWGGYLLEWPALRSPTDPDAPLRILLAGDTAKTDAYARLRSELGGRGLDLAVMPIGAYDPWIFNHCSPEQAWSMAVEDLGAARLLPVHYDTFRLSNEPRGEPLERLRRAAHQAGEPGRIVGAPYGEPVPLVATADAAT